MIKPHAFLGPYRVSCHRRVGVEIMPFEREQDARLRMQTLATQHPGARITLEKVIPGKEGLELIAAITGQTI